VKLVFMVNIDHFMLQYINHLIMCVNLLIHVREVSTNRKNEK